MSTGEAAGYRRPGSLVTDPKRKDFKRTRDLAAVSQQLLSAVFSDEAVYERC